MSVMEVTYNTMLTTCLQVRVTAACQQLVKDMRSSVGPDTWRERESNLAMR